MGSLSSRPKAPAPQAPVQVVYYPSLPQTTSPSSGQATTGGTASSGSPSQTPEQSAAAARTSSLLQRSRGIFGTVQTSFRGLLDLASNSGSRKTLLGE